MIHEIECKKDLSFAVEGDHPEKVWTCKIKNRDGQEQLTKLIRESVDWTNKEERYQFYEKFAQLIREWQGRPLNPQKIGLTGGQIDWLLMEAANWRRTRCNYRGQLVVKFVRCSGYKDRVWKKGWKKNAAEHPVARTTALHVAARYHSTSCYCHSLIADLFEIYDRRNLNFAEVEGTGLTHLHVACMSDRHAGVVRSYLLAGRVDPNCRAFKTADTPLHYALRWLTHWRNIAPLLEAGANPKLANARGSTPLHVICQREEFRPNNRAKQFLDLTREMRKPVDVDVWDDAGSPLEWAVARLLPDTVDVLVDNGADLSNFTFPAADFFGECVHAFNNHRDQKPASCALYKNRLRLVSGALAVVGRLKKRGYQLEPSDARTIEQFFAKHGVSGRVSAEDSKTSYVRGTKRSEGRYFRKPTKSLLKECEKLKTPTQYYEFSRRLDGLDLHPDLRKALDQHLCERAARGFFWK